jgi:hypothetical protein
VEEGSLSRDISGGFVLSHLLVFLGVQGCVRKLTITTFRIRFKFFNQLGFSFVRGRRRWRRVPEERYIRWVRSQPIFDLSRRSGLRSKANNHHF